MGCQGCGGHPFPFKGPRTLNSLLRPEGSHSTTQEPWPALPLEHRPRHQTRGARSSITGFAECPHMIRSGSELECEQPEAEHQNHPVPRLSGTCAGPPFCQNAPLQRCLGPAQSKCCSEWSREVTAVVPTSFHLDSVRLESPKMVLGSRNNGRVRRCSFRSGIGHIRAVSS